MHYFYGSQFSCVKLESAELHGADLSETELHGANLSGAELHGANLFGWPSCTVRI